MLGQGFKKYAKELGFTCEQGVAYGEMGGYLTTFLEGIGTKTLAVNVCFSTQEQRLATVETIWEDEVLRNCRVQEVLHSPVFLIIEFYDNPGTMKCIRRFAEHFFPVLPGLGGRGAGYCTQCDQPLEPAAGEIQLINSMAVKAHRACVRKIAEEVEQSEQTLAEQPKNYGLGLLGAVLGGIVGAIPWAAAYYFSWFAGWLGLLIGFTVKKGYELLGGKAGRAKVFIILAVTLLSVVFAQLICDAVSIAAMITNGELTEITYGQIPRLMLTMLSQDLEYVTSTIKNIGVGFLFALLGVWNLLKEVWKESRKVKIKHVRNG